MIDGIGDVGAEPGRGPTTVLVVKPLVVRTYLLTAVIFLAASTLLTVVTLLGMSALPLAAQEEPEPIRAGVAPPPGDYAPGIDVVHYEVEVGLGWGSPTFEGITHIRVAVETDAPILPLDLTGLTVLDVDVDGRDRDFRYEEGVLRVPLTDRVAGDTVMVRVHYGGVPDDGLILGENVHGAPSAFVDNWPNRTRFWLPTVDHPADKASVRFTVHAPGAWRVVANGALETEAAPTPVGAIGPADAPGPTGERRTWVWDVDVPISTYNMVIGAADLSVRTVGLAACGRAPETHRDDGCVEVTTWIFPEDVERAEPSFRRAAEMTEYFTDTFGPFPFAKLANVQSATRFGGMENASAIFYSEEAIAAGRNIEGTVSHEIAHQWFGDAVTEADWNHLWLSEGFASYFGDQFFEVADGPEAFRALMEESRQQVIRAPVANRPIYDPEQTDLFALLNANNYPKGAWVLHMLRGVIGDEDFFQGVRSYYLRFLHQAVTTEDFQAVVEEASGQDLEWFFQQWVYEPGYPTFELEWVWTPDGSGPDGVLEVTVRQIQPDQWPAFRMPVELALVSAGERRTHQVEVQGRVTTIRLDDVEGPLDDVLLDPDGWILKGDAR